MSHTFAVWHRTTPTFEALTDAQRESFAYFPADGWTLVATVDAEGLNDAFRLTNSIDAPWGLNPGVVLFGRQVRSTSVGDIFVTQAGRGRFSVEPVGFKEF